MQGRWGFPGLHRRPLFGLRIRSGFMACEASGLPGRQPGGLRRPTGRGGGRVSGSCANPTGSTFTCCISSPRLLPPQWRSRQMPAPPGTLYDLRPCSKTSDYSEDCGFIKFARKFEPPRVFPATHPSRTRPCLCPYRPGFPHPRGGLLQPGTLPISAVELLGTSIVERRSRLTFRRPVVDAVSFPARFTYYLFRLRVVPRD